MRKAAPIAYPILPAIAERWSPRAFDAARPLSLGALLPLFEAARWAPSANNLQPWRFVYGLRGEAAYDRILACLKASNAAWARNSALLMVASAQTVRETGEPNRYASHDLGQALAYMVLQAAANGLAAHQMAGFDPEQARAELGIPDGYEPMTAVAVGWPADPTILPDDLRPKEFAPRVRRAVEEFAYPGHWPVPALDEV